MNDESTIQCGRVAKIVRLTPSTSGMEQEGQVLEGYGIIRAPGGREVFFVAASLSEIAFAQLQTGMPVRFTLEPGPFAKALEVWFDDEPISERSLKTAQSNSPQ